MLEAIYGYDPDGGGSSGGVTVSESNLPDYETILNNSSAGAYGPAYGMVLNMVQNMARNSTEDLPSRHAFPAPAYAGVYQPVESGVKIP